MDFYKKKSATRLFCVKTLNRAVVRNAFMYLIEYIAYNLKCQLEMSQRFAKSK